MNQIYVTAVKDYIVEIAGQANFALNQWVVLEKNQKGVIIKAEQQKAYLMVDCEPKDVRINSLVQLIHEPFNVVTNDDHFGSIINIYGKKIISNQPKNQTPQSYPNKSAIFAQAVSINGRLNLDTQLETGIFAIDMLYPIGIGQRQLIIGDQQSGKTSLCLTTIIQQKYHPKMRVIFVAIGIRIIDLKKIYNVLKNFGAIDYTMILYASANHAMQQYLAPYIAMNHAENLAAAGFDVLVVIDNLTNHSNILREMALLTNLPVGKEAFSKTLFYDHASLLERAGKFRAGGSITCLPIVKTINNNITALLPSNIISITDGQIILDLDLKHNGMLPAIDLKRSVSRLGSIVQIHGLRNNSGIIRKINSLAGRYAQLENVSFSFGPKIQQIIQQGEMLQKALKQGEFSNYSVIYQFILSMIIVHQLVANTNELEEKLKFLNLYFTHSTLGQILGTTLQNQINTKVGLDQELIRQVLANAFEQYDLIKKSVTNPHAPFVFNSQNFCLDPQSVKIISQQLWAK